MPPIQRWGEELTCWACGTPWTVSMERDLGQTYMRNEDDSKCPECGVDSNDEDEAKKLEIEEGDNNTWLTRDGHIVYDKRYFPYVYLAFAGEEGNYEDYRGMERELIDAARELED